MSKAKNFINTKCYQLGNPVEPLIFKADAIEAVRFESDEVEKRAIEAYRQLCPCYQNGKCKSYPHNQKQGTQTCDMECVRMTRLREKLEEMKTNINFKKIEL